MPCNPRSILQCCAVKHIRTQMNVHSCNALLFCPPTIASSRAEHCWPAVLLMQTVAFTCLASPSVLSLMQPCQVVAWASTAWGHQQTSAGSRCQSAGLLQVYAAASLLMSLAQPDLAIYIYHTQGYVSHDHELVAVLCLHLHHYIYPLSAWCLLSTSAWNDCATALAT